MLLTTGSQQAIDLLARVYLEPGDVVLVENPTYLAALQVFHFHGVQYLQRMQLMLEFLTQRHWTDIRWNEPEGGIFLWGELPPDWDAERDKFMIK